jgi:hypothetical protein
MKNFYNGLRTPILNSFCDVESRRTARLMAAAPEMLALLELLAAGYECPPVMSGDNVYDSRDELLRETDHYSCLVDKATQLLAKIEREDA